MPIERDNRVQSPFEFRARVFLHGDHVTNLAPVLEKPTHGVPEKAPAGAAFRTAEIERIMRPQAEHPRMAMNFPVFAQRHSRGYPQKGRYARSEFRAAGKRERIEAINPRCLAPAMLGLDCHWFQLLPRWSY